MKTAYKAFYPEDTYKTDNLDPLVPRHRTEQYHKDLARGLAKPEDFERYVYGGTYDRKAGTDDRDRLEDRVEAKYRQWNEDAKDLIEKEK